MCTYIILYSYIIIFTIVLHNFIWIQVIVWGQQLLDWRFFFSISCKVGLLATNSHGFAYLEVCLFCLYSWNIAQYSVLDWHFFFLWVLLVFYPTSFQTPLFLRGRHVLILFEFPYKLESLFFLAACKIFFLWLSTFFLWCVWWWISLLLFHLEFVELPGCAD